MYYTIQGKYISYESDTSMCLFILSPPRYNADYTWIQEQGESLSFIKCYMSQAAVIKSIPIAHLDTGCNLIINIGDL